MNGYKWAIYGLYLFSWIGTILMIGKPRKPITPELAVASTLLMGVVLTLVYLS